jgi:hypothetical protein
LERYAWRLLVEGVTGLSIGRECVFGKCKSGWFLARSEESGGDREQVVRFTMRGDLIAQLRDCGAGKIGDLASPDSMAAERSSFERRPWEYHQLKGLGGLSDGDWASVLVLLSFAGSMVVGLFVGGLRRIVVLSVVLGVVSGVMGDSLVFEGGAFGVFGLPICTTAIGVVSRGLRKTTEYCVARRRRRDGSSYSN